MSDENRFKELLIACGAFSIVKEPHFELFNPRNPGSSVEIDNVCQKRNVVFIFEGSKGKPNVSQLKERFFLFMYNKTILLERRSLLPYNLVRVFYYNLKKQRLVEFDEKGRIVQTFSYGNSLELVGILRNL